MITLETALQRLETVMFVTSDVDLEIDIATLGFENIEPYEEDGIRCGVKGYCQGGVVYAVYDSAEYQYILEDAETKRKALSPKLGPRLNTPITSGTSAINHYARIKERLVQVVKELEEEGWSDEDTFILIQNYEQGYMSAQFSLPNVGVRKVSTLAQIRAASQLALPL